MKKKIVWTMLCLALSVSLTACGAKKEAEDTAAPVQEEEEAPAPEEEDEEPEEAQPEEEPEEAPEAEELPEGNMILNGDFSNGKGQWSTYLNGGKATLGTNDDGQLTINIMDTGSLDYSVQAYYDGIKLENGVVYKFAFDMAVSTPRTVVWRIQLNGGDYHPYFIETIAATTEMQHYEYELKMEEGSDPAPRLCINVGTYEGDGDLGEHVVMLDNFEFSVLDASGRATADAAVETPDINVSQVGYLPEQLKKATFRGDAIGDSFEVIDVASGESVFTGQITGEGKNAASKENCGVGDFSSLTKEGTYKVVNEGCGESYEFVIGSHVYDDLLKDTVRMLYLQRCGCEIPEKLGEDFLHPACHEAAAVVYGTDQKKDVSGGWHDAGDYGRYVVSGAKAAADLLLAYEKYPEQFGDDFDIPESGNGQPDVLDEVRYELEWMLKMQDDVSGGVYHKVTCANFPGTVLAQDETEELVICPISNCATGDFAAVMAMAGRIYKGSDAAFADTCLKAAQKALAYLEANEDAQGFTNPSDIVTGEYPDDKCADEKFWALAELYKTTGESKYHEELKAYRLLSVPAGLGWQQVGYYGMYAYLTSENTDAAFSGQIMDVLDYAVETLQKKQDEDAYDSTLGTEYPWGSNMSIANNGMLYLIACEMAEKNGDSAAASYLCGAQSQLAYLLGNNANSYCFVTGYGQLSPQHTHHRPSQVLKKSMKGMLVGGPDSNLEDPFAKATLADSPKAKCYADNEQSYSCNEVTVYWNSPLIYLLSGVMSR